MAMAREFNAAMGCILIRKFEDLATAHGDHLFGSREPAIISHDSPHQASSQKHVGSFKQNDLSALIPGR
jgi:hypothetical protein